VLPPDHLKARWLYADAMEAYRKGRWEDALALFGQALTHHPADGPSRALAQRCREYQARPPERWDGVFDQDLK
jgi:cytochrome c-type biogenesis protein CcmH/NrfG